MSRAHHVHIWQVSLHNILSPFLSNSNRQQLIVKSRKTGLVEVQSDKEACSKPAGLISCKTSCVNSVRQSSSVAWGYCPLQRNSLNSSEVLVSESKMNNLISLLDTFL